MIIHPPNPDGQAWLRIDIASQRLLLMQAGQLLADYPISTAANGTGEQFGSGCTPTGWHQIRARIGAGCPLNSVFVGRRPSGEIYTPTLANKHPGRDWILTRILWLSGLEPGRNRLGQVDTMRRFIYIHGCPDGTPLGVIGSHGCVRMDNHDLLTLFDCVKNGTRVQIG